MKNDKERWNEILSTIGIKDCESCEFFGECLDEELRVYREKQKMRSWVRKKK